MCYWRNQREACFKKVGIIGSINIAEKTYKRIQIPLALLIRKSLVVLTILNLLECPSGKPGFSGLNSLKTLRKVETGCEMRASERFARKAR